MERILTTEQMHNADKYTIDKLGLSSEILIERAGNAIAQEILSRFHGGRVLVCIGKGNNGEDGRVIAKLLSKIHGFSVAVLNVYNGIFKLFEKKHDIIVDCIFGTGLNREVEGKYKKAIELINQSGSYVISCDVPSGLNSDSGRAMGIAVKANLTVAVQEYKLGHFLNDGPDYSGEVIVKDIGISVWEEYFAQKLTVKEAKKYFLPRKRNVNKGNFGKVCVVGGSKAFFGSVLLSANALAALKMGAGYSYLCVPESLFSIYAGLHPECIIKTLKDKEGFLLFNKENLDELMGFSSIAFGMGVGVSEDIYEIIKYLLKNYKGRLLLDADALNTLSKYGLGILIDKTCDVVLTPHIGEFSRLSGIDKEKIFDDCISIANEFAKKYNVTLLLKSSTSVITNGEKVIINITGNNGLAKAGSGDVLSGLIAGIISRDNDLIESVAVASYIFGIAGEMAVQEQNEYTITASDVVNCLPKAINSL